MPARASYVARLDQLGAGYYLVIFGEEVGAVGVAAIDGETGDVSSHARLAGTRAHLPITAARALELGDAGAFGSPRLVWRPCRASQAMLSPIWEIQTAGGPVYVNQQGRRWTQLDPAGPGG
ncbi:MAG TPA: hypothetical protein VN893_12515 [Bryobacteraceae bacterium]|nr:hypothetical protein [Bryobacteraceae bacterium]